jgi:hypothetical protein
MHGSRNTKRIRGDMGRTSGLPSAKSISAKVPWRKSDDRVQKAVELTPGGLCAVSLAGRRAMTPETDEGGNLSDRGADDSRRRCRQEMSRVSWGKSLGRRRPETHLPKAGTVPSSEVRVNGRANRTDVSWPRNDRKPSS